MNTYIIILKQARTALIVFTLSVVLGLVSIASLSYLHSSAARDIDQQQALLQSTNGEIQVMTDDLSSIENNLAGFKHLTRLGLLGEPDREAWIERLDALYLQSGLPQTQKFSLLAPEPFTDSDSVGGLPTEPQAQAFRHDLQININGIHEGEFLTFADKMAAEWQVPYRIEKCDIARDVTAGLDISCTLRLFSLPLQTNTDPVQN